VNPSQAESGAGTPVGSSSETQLRQGDVIEGLRLPLSADVELLQGREPCETVVLSQTCDVVRETTLTLVVCPLTRLSGGQQLEAAAGRRPRYVQVPAVGQDAFADLDFIATVAKAEAAKHSWRRGLKSDDEVRRFARAVGRRFSRFAFPNEVVPWLQPLSDALRSKHERPTSPEGAAARQIAELRVEADGGWAVGAPYALTLAVIVEPGTLPVFPDDELPSLPEELQRDLRPNEQLQSPTRLAEMLSAERDPVRRYWIWQALGEAWAARCRPAPSYPDEVHNAVLGGRISAEVLAADEYSLSRYRKSEQLDLDYLSPPLPI
jgi:hypothetical protein